MMKTLIKGLLCFSLCVSLISCSDQTDAPVADTPLGASPPPNAKIVGNYTSWSIYSQAYLVTDIPANKLTCINYEFANIDSTGQIVLGDEYADTQRLYPGDSWDDPLRGNFKQLYKLKTNNPNLKALISVGGWTWSNKFSNAALTDASRQIFARSVVDFISKYHYSFDGINIDWEYPVSGGLDGNINRPEDKTNYTLLLQEIRRQLDALALSTNQRYYLTITAPADYAVIGNFDLGNMHQYLDWVNVTSYDFHGPWERTTNFNAPLNMCSNDPNTNPAAKQQLNVGTAVQLFLNAGVPADKIVMGLASNGRSWSGVNPGSLNGLFQTATSAGPGTWESGVVDYDDVQNHYLGSNGYVRYWNDEAKVPYLYSPLTKVFITYDDAESIGAKADYAKANNLGGIMISDLSSNRSGSLLDVARKKMGF